MELMSEFGPSSRSLAAERVREEDEGGEAREEPQPVPGLVRPARPAEARAPLGAPVPGPRAARGRHGVLGLLVVPAGPRGGWAKSVTTVSERRDA